MVRHPLFARVYVGISRSLERRGRGAHRSRALADARGRLVEVGCGQGVTFGHYPPAVSEVVAVEPEPYLRMEAERAAAIAPVPVRVVAGTADNLPIEDASADAGVLCLVLCSVPDQASALAELFRVVRPGGRLHFYEHVIARGRLAALLQRAANVVWPRIAGGCHVGRDTRAAIEEAGFRVERCHRFAFRPWGIPFPSAPRILGVAVRP